MERMLKELDARALAPARRHQEIFQALDLLAPGEGIELVLDHYPKPLLYQLQAERQGRFDWNVLEQSPPRFRVGIVRRASEEPRGVSECLQGDHRRLDELALAAERALASGDRAAAARHFGEFACGLNRHIDIEEFVVFPVFERVSGMAHGPTDVMRDEHRRIRRCLDEAATALGAQDDAKFTSSVRAMKAVLVEHNMKEEHVLYPATDDGLSSDRDRDDLVRQMQAM
jgi:uncharacterized protein (DUF2249 family)/hemerythrin-like domain-containing protein